MCPNKSCQHFQTNPKYHSDLNKALRFSFGFGVINFFFAIPAIFLIDKLGRRPLLLFTLPFMAIFQLLIGISFKFNGEALKICVPFFAYLFDVFYSLGTGPVPFVYASESMPLYVRDLGMSVATSVNWILNWILAFTFTKYWDEMGPTGTFCFFAACACSASFWSCCFSPRHKTNPLKHWTRLSASQLESMQRTAGCSSNGQLTRSSCSNAHLRQSSMYRSSTQTLSAKGPKGGACAKYNSIELMSGSSQCPTRTMRRLMLGHLNETTCMTECDMSLRTFAKEEQL